jgi:hypothetical protein
MRSRRRGPYLSERHTLKPVVMQFGGFAAQAWKLTEDNFRHVVETCGVDWDTVKDRAHEAPGRWAVNVVGTDARFTSSEAWFIENYGVTHMRRLRRIGYTLEELAAIFDLPTETVWEALSR